MGRLCSLWLSVSGGPSPFHKAGIRVTLGPAPEARVLVPFGCDTPSTAAPGVDSVHKCHHHKHSQSRHNDTLRMLLKRNDPGQFANGFQRVKNERTSFHLYGEFHKVISFRKVPVLVQKKQVSAV